jgi:hypothetical protein
MSSAFHHGEIQDNSWTHRFWKKARRFGVKRSMSASLGGSDNISAVNQVSEKSSPSSGRLRMKLSGYQKQTHEAFLQRSTDQPKDPQEKG